MDEPPDLFWEVLDDTKGFSLRNILHTRFTRRDSEIAFTIGCQTSTNSTGATMTVPTYERIQDLERGLLHAMRHSSLDELDELLADDLVFTDHLGGLWGKQDDLAAHRSGMIRISAVSASQQRIQILDGAAIVNVLLDISGTFGGEEASGLFRFTRVWAQTANGLWQVVAAQSTLVTQQGAGSEQ